MRKKVRIYGTLGPACAERGTLEKMILEGMGGVRLNLSHTLLEDASELIEAYRDASKACAAEPELLIDMQGPELRIGALEEPMLLEEGAQIAAHSLCLPQEVSAVLDALPLGAELLLDDGKLLLVKAASMHLRVVRGGVLESRKSAALPGVEIKTPAMTESDIINIKKASSFGVSAVMQPFVRGKDDLLAVRAALDSAGLE